MSNGDEHVDEYKLHSDVGRGAHAAALLQDELLNEAFNLLDKELIDQWRVTTDPAIRERIWTTVQLASKVPDMLLAVLQNGKLAKAHLDLLQEKEGRKQKK